MAAIDDPEHYSFTRDGIETSRSTKPAAMASWADTLQGPLRQRYLELIGVAAGSRALATYYARRQSGLKPGFTKKGKAIDVGPGRDQSSRKP